MWPIITGKYMFPVVLINTGLGPTINTKILPFSGTAKNSGT